jgi:hypothetical protein
MALNCFRAVQQESSGEKTAHPHESIVMPNAHFPQFAGRAEHDKHSA